MSKKENNMNQTQLNREQLHSIAVREDNRGFEDRRQYYDEEANKLQQEADNISNLALIKHLIEEKIKKQAYEGKTYASYCVEGFTEAEILHLKNYFNIFQPVKRKLKVSRPENYEIGNLIEEELNHLVFCI